MSPSDWTLAIVGVVAFVVAYEGVAMATELVRWTER